MKTLDQIRSITDIDARIINASALLELELRKAMSSPGSNSLGCLVQMFKPFQEDQFVKDVNFALGVRNAIAHWKSRVDYTETERSRAADCLTRAIQIVQRENSAIGSARRSSPDLHESTVSTFEPPAILNQSSATRELGPAGDRANVIVSFLNVIVLTVLAIVVLCSSLFQIVSHLGQRALNTPPEVGTLGQTGQMPIIRPAKKQRHIPRVQRQTSESDSEM